MRELVAYGWLQTGVRPSSQRYLGRAGRTSACSQPVRGKTEVRVANRRLQMPPVHNARRAVRPYRPETAMPSFSSDRLGHPSSWIPALEPA